MTQGKLPLDVELIDSAYYKMMHAPLPERTESYTPISHKSVIDYSTGTLQKMGFTIKNSIYRSSIDGLVGQGEYHLQYGNDPEMGLMLAWQNSYNKQVSFKYAIGAHVFVCSNGMVAGDLASYRRKHTGTADEEALQHIETYVGDAKMIFERLIHDREILKNQDLTSRQVAEMIGRMYIEDQIITSTQINIMKRELEKPTYDYGVDPNNAWAVYNYATHAFKEDSPRNWIKRHSDLHNFFASEFGIEGYSIPKVESVLTETSGVIEMPSESIVLTETPVIKSDIEFKDSVDNLLDMF
jgi:hypothetical protein